MLLQLLALVPLLVHGMTNKPQMGWNSWNAFKAVINESIIFETADEMVKKGFVSAGYEYLVLDDGWADQRNASGYQQPNTTRFLQGIAVVADYVHKRNLKLGIYSDAGIMTCSFRPGSYGYEELDAATFASWGVDYLKYDNCGGFQANTLAPQERFWRMASALKSSGRDIFYSLCQWGNQFPWYWADQFSDSYRVSGDIQASFSSDKPGVCTTAHCLNIGYSSASILTMIRKMRELSYFQKPGSWADMDLLEIGSGALSEFEEQTHFSFWAALKSPLIISTDLKAMPSSSLSILLNKEIIAINQDNAGIAVDYVPELSDEGSKQIWAGPLASGASQFVILALNEKSNVQNISIPLSRVPRYSSSTNGSSIVRDVWAKQDLGQAGASVSLTNVGVHETRVLVFSRK